MSSVNDDVVDGSKGDVGLYGISLRVWIQGIFLEAYESTTVLVVQAVVLSVQLRDVAGDLGRLVRGGAECVREASAGSEGSARAGLSVGDDLFSVGELSTADLDAKRAWISV